MRLTVLRSIDRSENMNNKSTDVANRILQPIVLLTLLLSVLAAPSPVTASQDEGNCIRSFSGAESDVADIRATVEQSPNTSEAVRITYDTRTFDGEFGVDLPSDVEVIAMNGFRFDEEENHYRYTGGENPFIEYQISIDGEQRQYASSENWIFAPTPTHFDVGVNLHPRPTGVIGDKFLYVGNYTRYTSTQGCHDISVIVASAGELEAPPDQILEALRYTSTELDIGHRYEEVRIFTTPGMAHPPQHGFAVGNEAWVSSSLSSGVSGNQTRVFIHEYIHTRQAFGGIQLSEMSWFNEGMPDYYSYKMMAELGLISPERYNHWLAQGSTMEGVLTKPSNWSERYVAYARGGAFLAVLDAKIQASSNNSLEDVVRRINSRGDPRTSVAIQRHLFIELVRNVSTVRTADWAKKSLSSNEPFEFEQAKMTQTQSRSKVVSVIERRIGERPFVAVLTAFLLGILFVELVNDLFSKDPEDE